MSESHTEQAGEAAADDDQAPAPRWRFSRTRAAPLLPEAGPLARH